MKTKSKALLLSFSAVLLVTGSLLGTMAYLTSTDDVTNTFTVGSVGITLDEAHVNPDGTVKDDTRVKENSYHLIPGHNYIKDPTIRIDDESEEAYLFVTLQVDDNADLVAALKNHNLSTELTSLLNGLDSSRWTVSSIEEDATGTKTYTFVYKDKISGESADIVLFKDFTVPEDFTKEDLATLDKFKLTVKAYAVQADGFEDRNNNGSAADEAWADTFAK